MWKPQNLDSNTFRIGCIILLIIALAVLPSQYRPQLAAPMPPITITYTKPASDFTCATRGPAYTLAEFMAGVKQQHPNFQRIPSMHAVGACPEGTELIVLPKAR